MPGIRSRVAEQESQGCGVSDKEAFQAWLKKRKIEDVETLVPDMAGEAILEEIDHPNTFRVISSFLKKCCGAMILVDAAKLLQGGQEQEFFTMKLLSYMAELDDHPRNGWRCLGRRI